MDFKDRVKKLLESKIEVKETPKPESFDEVINRFRFAIHENMAKLAITEAVSMDQVKSAKSNLAAKRTAAKGTQRTAGLPDFGRAARKNPIKPDSGPKGGQEGKPESKPSGSRVVGKTIKGKAIVRPGSEARAQHKSLAKEDPKAAERYKAVHASKVAKK
tara:strand:+ start:7847 stop:8326 length:480 start_codon:yes stop_codon:yes gene_type:complete